MMSKNILSSLLLILISLVGYTKGAQKNDNEIYVVYMGAPSSTNGSVLRDDHAKLLYPLLRRNGNVVVHTYRHGFSGFAARLSEEEANLMARKPGVVSVFRDPMLKLHTTHSWEFLKYQMSLKIDASPKPSLDASDGYDSIIGILDTGIWPESASFDDKGMSPIPSRWNGTCKKSYDFNSTNCNRKLIGARYYVSGGSSEYATARDKVGHGTHVASTAVGSTVTGASYYGLAAGSAKGGAPAGTRIAMYGVCSPEGCAGSAIMAAFDDAVADGVDVLSLSLGAPAAFGPPLESDPIAIGAFHATERGITVVCSAGNDGPDLNTVSNSVPWILTVGATTIDRDFESDVVFGNATNGDANVIKGEAINFSALQKTAVYPLILGTSAKKNDSDDDAFASDCVGNMDESKVKGKIVVCEKQGRYSPYQKMMSVRQLGGAGVIIVDDKTRDAAENYKEFPATVISSNEAHAILTYLNSTASHVATILPTLTVPNYKPAPSVAYFSSRGPSHVTPNILKPDISAPGVNILASWIGKDSEISLEGKETPLFNIISGTSMACPHVSAVAAKIRSRHPTWTNSAIKSAIITTATQSNNLKEAVKTESGSAATPYDFGAGEVMTEASLEPGLVYETSTDDYLNFFCYLGYDVKKIKTIARVVPGSFACPAELSSDQISNMNYPSISISNFNATKNINRTVTYAGDAQTVFTVIVEAPSGLIVKVVPSELRFKENNQKLSYQVSFSAEKPATKGPIFGSILWTNGQYNVRSPFVITT